MKRKNLLLIAIISAVVFVTACGKQSTNTSPEIQPPTIPEVATLVYQLNDDQTAYSVTGIETDGLTVVVPSLKEELPVVEIAEGAFKDNTTITSVTIPDEVTTVGANAFQGCTSLTSVTLPSGLTTINSNLFYDCSNLTNVTLPTTVTKIDMNAFTNCSALTQISIPEAVTEISAGAFQNCSSLTNFQIPKNVTTLGSMFISGCNSLETLTVQTGNSKYGVVNNCLIEISGELLVAGCKTSSIPSNGVVTKIGAYAFYGIKSLQTINIPKQITSIRNYAFSGSGLKNVTISDNITTLGNHVFEYCLDLETATIDYSAVENNTFRGCSNLKTVNLTSSTSINYSAFEDCTSLTTISMDNVTTIGSSAFKNCTSLTNVSIKNVKTIGYSAFENCTNLKNVIYGTSTLKVINASAFKNCTSLENVTTTDPTTETETDSSSESDVDASASVLLIDTKTIGVDAFANCYNLINCELIYLADTINVSAFENCYKLTISRSSTLTVSNIGEEAFKNCTSLTSLKFGVYLYDIDAYAFEGCTSLTSITLGGTNNDVWYVSDTNLYPSSSTQFSLEKEEAEEDEGDEENREPDFIVTYLTNLYVSKYWYNAKRYDTYCTAKYPSGGGGSTIEPVLPDYS